MDLVTLQVTVADPAGKPVLGLKKENFRLFDNDIEQAIRHFGTEDRPFSMGLVLDRSGSMAMIMEEVYQAAFHTIRASKTEDEFFIMVFNHSIDERQDFSTNRELLRKRLKGLYAAGQTALYDAVLAGLQKVQGGSYEKKALLVVTDGADNSSHVSFGDLLRRARQAETAIYVVGLFGMDSGPNWLPFSTARSSRDEKIAAALLTELAEATGAKAYFPKSMKECEQICIAIADELRQQYELGYYPEPKLQDGSWRSVHVELQLPAELAARRLLARTRAGYFAPREQQAVLEKH